MLYNRSSINYYIEIMCLRKLFRYLLRPNLCPPYWRGLLASIAGSSKAIATR